MTQDPTPTTPAEPTGPTIAMEPLLPEAALPPSATRSLADAVREIERHVAAGGWDAPVRVFALVSTAAALQASPELADQLDPSVLAAASIDAHHLTSIEQEGLPAADDLEHLLGGLSWPSTVLGTAVVVERVVLPPAAEDDMPSGPDAALEYLLDHPERQDVRIAAGVLRTGETWCAVRTRANDADNAVAVGEGLVPGLLEAVRGTLA